MSHPDQAASPPKMFIHASVFDPITARVRIQEPERCLNRIAGVRAVSVLKWHALHLARRDEAKVFIWQRALLSRAQNLADQKVLLRLGYLIVSDLDDDPDHFPDIARGHYFLLTSCHCVQTSTEALANELRKHNPHVQVFPNQLAQLPPWRPRSIDGPATVFFGAINRQVDWQPLVPALNRLLVKHGSRVRMRIVGDQEFFDALQTQHKVLDAYCPYERYLEILGACDVALLPLSATRFNSFKSDLKFLECAGQGVAVLASPTVYQSSIVPEQTGLLFHSLADFEAQLERLIVDGPLRQTLAANAYRHIAESRLLDQHCRTRYDWYLKMLGELPQLNADLRRRIPELFED